MPINTKYIEPFAEGKFMHIICKAIGSDLLFKNDNNRDFFLKRYVSLLTGYLDTYVYCLLDNHVHWLIKCAEERLLKNHIEVFTEKEYRKSHQSKFLSGELLFEEALEFQFKDFFISYAKAFNNQNDRNGALFINPFRRIAVKDDTHITQLIVYIHANAIKHKLTDDVEAYRYSSYKSILSGDTTFLKAKEVIDWFGNKDLFIRTHREMVSYYYNNPYSME